MRARAGSSSLLHLAAEVLLEWQATGRGPRDLLADRKLRELPPADRARLAVALAQAVTWRRRAEFAFGAATARLPAAVREVTWLLAGRVWARSATAAVAARTLQQFAGVAIDFEQLAADGARLRAIADPVTAFGVRHSLPDWLASRLLAEFGDAAAAVADGLAVTPARTIRANLLRVADRDELARELAALGVPTRRTRHAPHGLHVDGDADLFALPAFTAGHFEQQDEASQLGALVVMPPPRGRVLDACAGSGGKTLAIAMALGNRGSVLAVDPHAGRLAGLRQRLARGGVDNVQVAVTDEASWPSDVEAFARRADRIVLDVPCTGVGSWPRRPEGRFALQPRDVGALQKVQHHLLERAIGCLQPGARLIWSTCTLFAAENEQPVNAALARHPDLELVPLVELLGRDIGAPIASRDGTFLALRPDQHGTSGFFAAVLRRRRHRTAPQDNPT
ncbi:MAG: RsmB/NOP family class I SAM-dependent RNA methyltransferase [Planctomycetes bacterium]|nr:RsmB/NOP family class I SAM-dependent RNA methyltransferase [Planctomycetota bacterium]